MCVWSLQLHPTLCDPMDRNPPGSSVQRILQARILEWVAMPSSRGSSQPKDWTHISYVSCICKQAFPCGSAGKESACNAGDLGSIPGLGRFPGEGKVYPLQYSGLENSIQSMGSQRIGHNWATFTSLHLFTTSTTWEAQLICIKLNLNFKLLCQDL